VGGMGNIGSVYVPRLEIIRDHKRNFLRFSHG
jgi:hypothetical protein